MFERNRTDNRIEPVALPVELDLVDGTTLTGKLRLSSNVAPLEALNAPGGFVEFTPYTGTPSFIAKATIAAIRVANVARAPALQQRGGHGDDFDPHQVLGISTESTWEETRLAFVRLSKTYHPDLYTTAALPAEVASYLEATARRINAAYAALELTHRVQRRAKGTTSAPVFTSTPRG